MCCSGSISAPAGWSRPLCCVCCSAPGMPGLVAALIAGWTGRPGLVLGVGMTLAVAGYVAGRVVPVERGPEAVAARVAVGLGARRRSADRDQRRLAVPRAGRAGGAADPGRGMAFRAAGHHRGIGWCTDRSCPASRGHRGVARSFPRRLGGSLTLPLPRTHRECARSDDRDIQRPLDQADDLGVMERRVMHSRGAGSG